MKKTIISTMLIFVLIASMCVFPTYALESYVNGTNRQILAGETIGIMSLTTQCPSCGHTTFVLRCSEFMVGYDPDVTCVIPSHSPCTIVNRMAYKTYGTCSDCHLGLYIIYVYGTHIETCYYTGTPDVPYYLTCYFKG